eukprot:scaffold653095_cov62-Prasinocladus_malaysianus.AAC.1
MHTVADSLVALHRDQKHLFKNVCRIDTLMYVMVFSSLGITTFSRALTRLLVVLMATSRVRKE